MAKTLEQRIDDLRDTLETSEKFSETIDKLFLLAEVPEFLDLAVVKESEILDSVVAKALEQVIKNPKDIHMNLVCLEKYSLYHGSLIVGSKPGVVMYFDDIRMGMIAIPRNSSGEVSYLRFTADIMMDGTFPGKIPTTTND